MLNRSPHEHGNPINPPGASRPKGYTARRRQPPALLNFARARPWLRSACELPHWSEARVLGDGLLSNGQVTDAKHYIKHFGARAFKPVLGNGLVTSEGAFWHCSTLNHFRRSPAVQWHVEARIRVHGRAASPNFQTPASGCQRRQICVLQGAVGELDRTVEGFIAWAVPARRWRRPTSQQPGK